MNALTNTSCRMVKDLIRRLQSTSSKATSLEIKIPNRIERGPTDILKALEKTISKKISVPHYKYIDDPYLLPVSVSEQRFRSLSRESGKKAATWVYEEHADLFERELADPIIPDFLPPATYTTKDEVSEEILLNVISNGKTVDALQIYNLLDQNVSIKTKQSLLELLCFSNGSNLDQFNLQEERWFKMTVTNNKCVWNETEEIKKLSEFLISQDQETAAAAYNALICGTGKYNDVNRAWSLYSKCKEEKIPLTVDAYNEIIRIIPFLRGPTQSSPDNVFELLKEMSINGICPNIHTLDAALETTYTLKSYKDAMNFVHSLLGEFKVAGVKPSLTSFSHILSVATENSNSVISVLTDILSVLEQDTLTLRNKNDVHFFPLAMKIAIKHSNNAIGERVHALFLKDDNYKFAFTSSQEAHYYRQYVLMNLVTLPFEQFLKLYYDLTTYTYLPESSVVNKILASLQLQPNSIIQEQLPKLWDQVDMFKMFDVDNLLKLILDITCSCNLESESPLHEIFAKYVLNVWNFKQSKNTSIRKYMWDATILGNIVLILLRASWYDQTFKIISFMTFEETQVMGVMSTKQMNELLELCVLHGYGPIALLLIKYAINSGLEEATALAVKVYNAIPLSESEKQELISLVGGDVLSLQLFDKH